MFSKSKIRILIILLLIISVGLIVGYKKWFLQKDNNTSEPNQIEDQTESWKTYNNPTYHYSIKYHPDWHAQEENEPPYPPPPVGMSFSRRWNETGESCDFSIMSSNIADNFDGEIENIRQQKERQETTANINGVTAIQFSQSSGDSTTKTFYLTRNNISYRIGYNYSHNKAHQDLCFEVLEKMISTFQFSK